MRTPSGPATITSDQDDQDPHAYSFEGSHSPPGGRAGMTKSDMAVHGSAATKCDPNDNYNCDYRLPGSSDVTPFPPEGKG